jgi:hypothetical protein
MTGVTTLDGYLQVTETEISAAQLLALLGAPIQLAAPNSASQAALLRSLITSLRFGTTKYTNPSGRGGACVCYGNGLPAFGSGGNIPPFAITQITVVSGVVTLTVPGLSGSGNAFVGLKASVAGCTNAGNNAGNLAVVSSANGSLVITNGGAVTETPSTATLALNFPGSQGGGLIGGGSGLGDVNDLALLLEQSTESELSWISVAGFNGPASAIAGQPILLMNPLAGLFNPAQLAAGDSSLLVTAEFLVVQL